jgi:hypothetical protein
MAEIVLTAAQFRDLLTRDIEADTILLRRAALDACIRAEARAVELTNEEGLVDQGLFKNSWKASAISTGAELANDAPYAAVIEHGRRPGRPGPPLAPIRAWVHRKLVMTGEIPPEDEDSVAFAIRQKIHVKGTRPRFILQTVFDEATRTFVRDAVRRLRARHR